NDIWLADGRSGRARLMFKDRDDAWVDVDNVINNTFVWFEGNPAPPPHNERSREKRSKEKTLLYLSERDGWRHAYAVSRDGNARLITTGAFDVVSISSVDQTNGWLYYIASPDHATQRYLYRSRLDGSGQPQRVTPDDQPGTHTYNISPDSHWAFHTYSKFDEPGVSDVVSLPDHKAVRVFQDNAELKAKVAKILKGRTELFQVDIGDGVKLDGWLIKPAEFDESKKYPLIVDVY